MKTTIRTTVPLLANMLLALQNHQQHILLPQRSTVQLVEGHIRPILEDEAPIEVCSIWQREAYCR